MSASGLERRSPPSRLLSRGYGVYVVGASIIIGFLSWLALHMLLPVAAQRSDTALPSFVILCFEWGALSPLLALPALLCGLVLLRGRRRSLPLALLGTALLLLPLVVILYCFLVVVGGMYTYRPLS